MKKILFSLLVIVNTACSNTTHVSEHSTDTTHKTPYQPPQKPNIIMVFIDDMGFADISKFGNPIVETPNLDKLANQGLILNNFYVNSPICSASRVALKTGQYPQRARIHSYLASRAENAKKKMPDFLDPKFMTYARLLKQNGYSTAHFGKWHLGGGRDVDNAPKPQAYGYDESLVSFEGLGDRIIWDDKGLQQQSRKIGQGEIFDLPKHKTTETYVDRAIDFMQRNKKTPFLINVFPNDVHDWHIPSQAALVKWKGKGESHFEDEFFAVLEEMDNQLGRLFDSVKKLGLSEQTLIIVTSDNGPTDWRRYYKAGVKPPGFTGPFYGRKWSLYEGGIRMPFIAHWPSVIKPNSVDNETIMSAIDILPTLAAITQSTLPFDLRLDGENKIDVLLHQESAQRQSPLFWEYSVLGSIQPGYKPHRSPKLVMRDGDYKLLMNPDGKRLMLFNLVKDQGERTNIAKIEPEIVKKMKPQLKAWWNQMKQNY